MDLNKEDFEEEEEEEEEVIPPVAAEVQLEASDEQSPSNIVVGVLSKLSPQEEVVESACGTES